MNINDNNKDIDNEFLIKGIAFRRFVAKPPLLL